MYFFIHFYLETMVYKISAFTILFLSFLGPWDLFIWPHTDENMPKHNALSFSSRTSSSSHVRVPTPACMSWACPEGAHASAMWTYGPCSCSAPSPALTLAQHPSHELFQASLPTQEGAWAFSALLSEVISGLVSETQKGSLGSHTSWLKSHTSCKLELHYTCPFPVFHDLAASVYLLSSFSWKCFCLINSIATVGTNLPLVIGSLVL